MSEPDRRVVLARHYLEVGRPLDALGTLERGGVDLEDTEVWSVRAEALFLLDRYHEGAAAARDGLARDPDDVTLLDVLAMCELEQGRLAEAERALLAALEVWPEQTTLLAHYALLCARGAQFEKAHRLLDEASRLEPESVDVLRVRAQVSSLEGDRRRAKRDVDALLQADPEDLTANVLRANSLVEQSDIRGAVKHFERAARLDPGIEEIAHVTRHNRVLLHPLQWPIYPVQRFGAVKVWLTFVGLLVLFEVFGLWWLSLPLALLYLFMVFYSWTVAPLARWWMSRRLR